MARFKKIPQAQEGKIFLGDNIVNGIATLAVKEIPMVELSTDTPSTKTHSSAIQVKKEKDGVHIDIAVKVYYTQCVSDIAFKIQEAVRHNVESMTEYHIASVNVIIRGVSFDNKFKPTPIPSINVSDDVADLIKTEIPANEEEKKD